MTPDDGEKKILRLRFPDGDVELRWTNAPPGVGSIVRSRGTLWRVSHNGEEGAVTLEPAPTDGIVGGQHGPVVKPTPLGDEPLILETVVAA
jgi:hypothetical protein